MESIIAFLPLALLLLACPLGMAAIGGVPWLIARVKGEKKEFSMGCMSGMGGKCNHAEHQGQAPTEEPRLQEDVARLQREIETLRAEIAASTPVAEGGPSFAEPSTNGSKSPQEAIFTRHSGGDARRNDTAVPEVHGGDAAAMGADDEDKR